MSLPLNEITSDGPSRHRIRKGLILVSRGERREPSRQEQARLAAHLTQALAARQDAGGCRAEADPAHPALVSLVTPFAPLHTPALRDRFFGQLAHALAAAHEVAAADGFTPVGAGVNPYALPPGLHTALCADVHEIEVLDDLEVNRIYNLFRQYLPELVAISAHSALHAGRLQKDLSTRMRISPTNFTPPPLTLFSGKQLTRLKRAVRKDFGLGDLAQLDVNPVSHGCVALRFVDAQPSLRFIRAQVVLFQAIAVHGRSLARRGSQMPTLHTSVVGQNRALAIEAGPGAVFKADPRREVKQVSQWYQDRKVSERASTALIQAIQHRTVRDGPTILAALKTLRADYAELSPILLGAELRRRGEACVVNYGEHQVRTFYVAGARWPDQLHADMDWLVRHPKGDLLCNYNESRYAQLSAQITDEWRGRLAATRESDADGRPPRRQNDVREGHR